MAPSSSSPSARGTVAQHLSVRRREKRPSVSPSRAGAKRKKKYRSMEDIMRRAKFAVVDEYSHVSCYECGSGENDDQLLLCDKCDNACHMLCLRPIVVRVPIGPWYCPTCSDHPPPVQRFSQTKIMDFFRIEKGASSSSVKRISPQGKLFMGTRDAFSSFIVMNLGDAPAI